MISSGGFQRTPGEQGTADVAGDLRTLADFYSDSLIRATGV